MIHRSRNLLAVFVAAAALTGCVTYADNDRGVGERIEAAIQDGMERTGARGLAVALVEDGDVVFVDAVGSRNAANDPLDTNTIMYGASLTKAVFAYTMMQLVDEGRLDLDRPVAELLPKPLPEYGNLDAYGNWGDLAGDERWRKLTPRHLLTHSSGFANFAFLEPDGKLRFHFNPGTRYAYSSEGIMLLQFVLEQGLGLNMGAEIQARVFDRFGMTRTSMMWRPDFAANLADGWMADGKVEPHDKRSRVRAAGSMDTTIADFARFAAAFSQGHCLSAKSREEMVRGQLVITSRSQFPTLVPEALPEARWSGLSAGLGVVAFSGPQGPGFFKGGHNDSTGNQWVCIERTKRCVVMLSNDVRSEAAFPDIVEAALGETGAPWRWEYSQQVSR